MPSKHRDGIAKTRRGLPPVLYEHRWDTAVDDMPYQIRVPHPNSILNTNLPHQQAIHPSEGELHKFDILRFKMGEQGCFDSMSDQDRKVDSTQAI